MPGMPISAMRTSGGSRRMASSASGPTDRRRDRRARRFQHRSQKIAASRVRRRRQARECHRAGACVSSVRLPSVGLRMLLDGAPAATG